ncbi:MAG: hypothetical protein MJ189_03415, partial [Coriobacteriales bacterium]|nr:hypothetical protein [Coriobacteriales bacterium]
MSEKTVEETMASFAPFESVIPPECAYTNDTLGTLQVNVGYMCNIACRHCHLSCGPNRTEIMTRDTMQACIDAYKLGGFKSMDITGGAPEMNPDYEWFLEQVNAAGIKPMCRTNLCILTEEKYAHFADLYAKYDVTLVA